MIKKQSFYNPKTHESPTFPFASLSFNSKGWSWYVVHVLLSEVSVCIQGEHTVSSAQRI